jgi:iron complex transport system ATP-binding protein
MTTKDKTIEIRNLTIGYNSKNNTKTVSQNLSCAILSSELTCLVGANGAGKSTLLRTLSAFQPSLSGTIHIREREISSYPGKELAKIIGVVLTERINVHDMSVVELVSMGRSPYTGFWGTLSPEDKQIVQEAIKQVNISDLADRSIQTLSDGEKQKVMIAKALAQQTPVIFLDEPTAFLDFQSKIEIMQLLHRLCKEVNKTIFLSTHDLELAIQIADKIWIMDKKKGITVGTPEELIADGRLEKSFYCKGVLFDRQTGLFRITKKNE